MKPPSTTNEDPGAELRRAVVQPWLVARALVVIAALAAEWIAYDGTHGWLHIFVGRERGLMSWDADWYLRIARDGYDSLPAEGLRYFPLYPLMGRALAFGTDAYVKLSLLLIANAGALVLGALIYRLAVLEKDDRQLAKRAAWLVALAPPAFVLTMAYTESLAMSFAAGAFLCARRSRWGWVIVLGVAAGAVRPTGILLVPPLVIEALRAARSLQARQLVLRAAAVLSPVAGTGMYLLWSRVSNGDALLPLTVQQRSNGRGGFQLPLATFWEAATELFTEARIDQGLHLVWFGLLVALIVVSFRRWPASYGAFAVVSVGQAISTSNLNSLERYGYGAFPLILAAAALCRTPKAERTLVAGSGLAFTAYATAAFVSGYVP